MGERPGRPRRRRLPRRFRRAARGRAENRAGEQRPQGDDGNPAKFHDPPPRWECLHSATACARGGGMQTPGRSRRCLPNIHRLKEIRQGRGEGAMRAPLTDLYTCGSGGKGRVTRRGTRKPGSFRNLPQREEHPGSQLLRPRAWYSCWSCWVRGARRSVRRRSGRGGCLASA